MASEVYLNPFTDFGFKKLFGEEASLPLLKSLLNSLLPEYHKVEHLEFKSSEFMGRSAHDRRAIFDLYCETSNGEKIIVELQKEKQDFFKDRSVYYATFPIQEQAQRGVWDFKLAPVYCIGILNFCFREKEAKSGQVHHLIQLKDEANQVFYDKLTFIYIEMPNFKKKEHELKTQMDFWIYFFKNLENFEEIPRVFMGKEEFEEAFHKASLAKLSENEHRAYENSLKVYRDLANTLSYREKKGREKGLAEGREEGLVEGREEGLAEGREKGLAEALKKLISSGMKEGEARKVLGI